jgi:hypothetical protein
MSKWLETPDGALFSLRREVKEGAREQWAVVAREGGVEVLRADGADGAWQPGGERFADLCAVLEGLPELRTLHKDVINDFTLDAKAGLSEDEFLAMIDLRPEEGSDDPGEWEPGVLSEYDWDFDAEWAAQCDALTVVRMAGLRRGAAIAGIEWAGEIVPVLVYEDVPYDAVVRATAFGDSFPASNGGRGLTLLGSGLALSVPLGDEKEFNDTYSVVELPESGPELGWALAGWIVDIEFVTWAALLLEPLDPDGKLSADERAEWEELVKPPFGNLLYPSLEAGDWVADLRAGLTDVSGLYERVKDALADPKGADGQSFRKVLEDGNVPDLLYGMW